MLNGAIVQTTENGCTWRKILKTLPIQNRTESGRQLMQNVILNEPRPGRLCGKQFGVVS